MSAGVSAGIDMSLYLISKLTDEDTARRVQLALDYDPEPPFGAIDWTHVGVKPAVLRRAISLGAPVITAKAKRILRQEQGLAKTEQARAS